MQERGDILWLVQIVLNISRNIWKYIGLTSPQGVSCAGLGWVSIHSWGEYRYETAQSMNRTRRGNSWKVYTSFDREDGFELAQE